MPTKLCYPSFTFPRTDLSEKVEKVCESARTFVQVLEIEPILYSLFAYFLCFGELYFVG